jgi:hypothetical protein
LEASYFYEIGDLRLYVKTNVATTVRVLLVTVIFAFPISTLAMTVTLQIPEKYAEVEAGGVVYFETEVKYPENDTRKDLRIEYFVLGPDGKDVAYMKVLKAIETQASFMDSINIPGGVDPGMFTIKAKIADYNTLSEDVGASFQVIPRAGERIMMYLFIILGIVILIALLISIELFVIIRRKGV